MTSDDMQIWDVAFKLRQDMYTSSKIWKLEHNFKGKDEAVDLVQNHFKHLVGSPDSCKWD